MRLAPKLVFENLEINKNRNNSIVAFNDRSFCAFTYSGSVEYSTVIYRSRISSTGFLTLAFNTIIKTSFFEVGKSKVFVLFQKVTDKSKNASALTRQLVSLFSQLLLDFFLPLTYHNYLSSHLRY